MKKLCSILLVLMLFVSTGGTVLAEGNFPPPEQPTTRWWPGNPNAPVGSEEWIHQNWNYSGGDSAKQVSCAKKVIVPTVAASTAENILLWAFGGTLTVGSVFLAAGVSYVVAYYGCMVN